MTRLELKEWDKAQRQYNNGYHMSERDWQELVRLNHLVMEIAHKIHNDNMLKGRN